MHYRHGQCNVYYSIDAVRMGLMDFAVSCNSNA